MEWLFETHHQIYSLPVKTKNIHSLLTLRIWTSHGFRSLQNKINVRLEEWVYFLTAALVFELLEASCNAVWNCWMIASGVVVPVTGKLSFKVPSVTPPLSARHSLMTAWAFVSKVQSHVWIWWNVLSISYHSGHYISLGDRLKENVPCSGGHTICARSSSFSYKKIKLRLKPILRKEWRHWRKLWWVCCISHVTDDDKKVKCMIIRRNKTEQKLWKEKNSPARFNRCFSRK